MTNLFVQDRRGFSATAVYDGTISFVILVSKLPFLIVYLLDTKTKFINLALNPQVSQEVYHTTVRDGVEIDWLCAACAELTSVPECNPVAVPDSPPPSPAPASPTPVSPTAPSPTSLPLPVSPTAVSPVAIELLLDDPDPAEIVQQPHQLTFTIVDHATLKRKWKLFDNDG